MKYIDSHVHLGDCRVFEFEVTESQLMKAMEENAIDASIVQPCPFPLDYKNVHERIYALTQQYPGKFYGMVSINPHIPKEQYKSEVRHYVKDYGFVAIKMHTIGWALSPLAKDAEAMYEVADELGVPIMIHTGIGVPYALPSLCLPVAKKYPNVKFILAHAGGQIYNAEAMIVAQECDNVYLDVTWVGIEEVCPFAEQLGSKRLLFASDSLKNISLEKRKYELLGLNESELEDVYYKNAISVFNLKGFK